MAVLAVLVAVPPCWAIAHILKRCSTRTRATDQWNFYQAHKIRANETELAADLMGVVTLADKDAAGKMKQVYADHEKKWAEELKEEHRKKAEAQEAKVEQAEARADRFDLAEALLEIGLVITSVTLLTRSRIYWYLGLVFSLLGVASVVSAFFLK